MNLYSQDYRVIVTVYVKANSPQEAHRILAEKVTGQPIDLDGSDEIVISGTEYSDPNLPAISVSPAMTFGQPCAGALGLAAKDLP